MNNPEVTGQRALRSSNIELLRIVAMFCIILYHQLYFFVEKLSGNDALLHSLEVPFHVGVILFVLISGYFGIRTSLKGLINLLLPVAVYYCFGGIIVAIFTRDFSSLASTLLFVSNSPYWYVQVYLYLFLLSPLMNLYWRKDADGKKTLLMTIILGCIAVWCGTLSNDASVGGAKILLISSSSIPWVI